MSNHRISVLVCLAICFSSSLCFAGKLDSLRSKTKGTTTKASTPKRDRSDSDQKTSKRRDKSDKQGSFLPKIDLAALIPKPEPTRSQSKLSSVRDRVRRPSSRRDDRPRHPTPPGGGERPQRHDLRPRGGFGVSIGSTLPLEPCQIPATFVTERFYYPTVPTEPWTYDDPYIASPPYADSPIRAVPQVPPVMPPAGEVFESDGDLEPIEPCNPGSCHEAFATTVAWPVKPYHIRFEIDYAGDEADVSRMGFGLLANVTRGLGIDTGVRLFRERDTDFRDHLWLGDFNLTYELAASELMRMRAGIGVNFLADWYGSDAGLNLTMGTDIFLGPVTLTGEVDLGALGDTDLFHGRASAAWRCDQHVEAFVGYDYVDIGGVEFAGVLAGLRFRY